LERDGLIAQLDGPKHGKRRRVLIADIAALSRYAGEDGNDERRTDRTAGG
jgi:hypothetical protein